MDSNTVEIYCFFSEQEVHSLSYGRNLVSLICMEQQGLPWNQAGSKEGRNPLETTTKGTRFTPPETTKNKGRSETELGKKALQLYRCYPITAL